MSELAKVRLVRCPKCKKVLLEHINHSVYKCGGCDALLQAKKRVAEAETSSDKSDEGKIGGVTASKRVSEYKIRLVRCPKCRNLLPEPTNYSVYKCGGCGAVLRAKKRVAEAEKSSDKSDEGKIGGVTASKRVSDLFLFFNSYKSRWVRCRKCGILLQEPTNYSVYKCGGCGAVLRAKKRVAEAETSSDKSDEGQIGGISEKFSKKSEIFNFSEKGMVNLSDGSEYDVKLDGSSSSRAENREVLSDRVEKYRNGHTGVLQVDEFSHEKKGKKVEDLKPPNGNINGFQRSVGNSDRRIRERDEMEGFWRNPRMDLDFEGVRYSTSKYSQAGEGPSSYQLGSTSGYGEPVKNQNEMDGINEVEYLEQDRAELLRKKLDELMDLLNGRMVHQDPHAASETWFPDGSLGENGDSMQHPIPDRHVARRSPHISNYPEPYPFTNTHEIAMHTSGQVRGMDPVRSQMLRRAPHQAPIPLQQHSSHPYYSGHYIDDIDLHLPSCSCFHCYNKRTQVRAPIRPRAFYNRMYPDIPNNPMLYHHENPSVFGPSDYNSRTTYPRMHSHNPQSHTEFQNLPPMTLTTCSPTSGSSTSPSPAPMTPSSGSMSSPTGPTASMRSGKLSTPSISSPPLNMFSRFFSVSSTNLNAM